MSLLVVGQVLPAHVDGPPAKIAGALGIDQGVGRGTTFGGVVEVGQSAVSVELNVGVKLPAFHG